MAARGPRTSAPLERITIVGAGLIGASIALALRRALPGCRLTGVDPDRGVCAVIVPGVVDAATDDLAEGLRDAQLVFVACPVDAMAQVFETIARVAPPDCLVTDCGSTKSSVAAAAAEAFGADSPRFLAGHPIAGSEGSGPAAARADLFDGRIWLLCPAGPAQERMATRLGGLLERFGARVESIHPAAHDAMFAEFSHWPHAVAFTLCASIADGAFAEAARHFSGAGLRDTTRIGASSATLWAGILLDNRESALASARRFREKLDALEGALEASDRDTLEALFGAASRWRRSVD
ncbi:MAG: prephenate dehydrogenase [Burkholderiaceae bacterium]